MSLVEIIKQALKYIEEHLTLITAGLSLLSLILINVRILIEKKILSKFGLQEFYKKATISELLSDYWKWIIFGCLFVVGNIICHRIGLNAFVNSVSCVCVFIELAAIIIENKMIKKIKTGKKEEKKKLKNCGSYDIDCQIEESIVICNGNAFCLLIIALGSAYYFDFLKTNTPTESNKTGIYLLALFLIGGILYCSKTLYKTIGDPIHGVPYFSCKTYKELDFAGKKYAVIYTNDDNFCCLRCETADDKLTLLVDENYITNIAGCEFTRKKYADLTVLSDELIEENE